MLVDELEATDSRVELGPRDRLAIVGGCDANAWLAAVGSIASDGTISLERLSSDPDARLSGNNNAGVSVTWSGDGEVLFFDTTRVDATTGAPLDIDESHPELQVHTEAADGRPLAPW